MTRILFICHGNILRSFKKPHYINGLSASKTAYYTTLHHLRKTLDMTQNLAAFGRSYKTVKKGDRNPEPTLLWKSVPFIFYSKKSFFRICSSYAFAINLIVDCAFWFLKPGWDKQYAS